MPLCCFPAGDVLQFSVSLRGALLFPGQGFDAEGVGGRDRSHVHSQGDVGGLDAAGISQLDQKEKV